MPQAYTIIPRQVADRVCAACDTPVTVILAQPSRLEPTDNVELAASRARCTLFPCGHTFAAPRVGLIR